MYNDDDLVYVDPETKTVVGKVEWKGDTPLSCHRKDDPSNKRRRRTYPWGTYRSMRHIFLEKRKFDVEGEGKSTLDDIFKKPLEETFLGS
jgi:hypothetical protein